MKNETFLATLLQNGFNPDVARFATHIKSVLQQIRLFTGLNKGGKTGNIAFSCKTSCTVFFARFTEALERYRHADLADQTCGFLYLKVPNDFRGLSDEVRPRTRSEVPREQNELLVRREENEVEEQDGQADGQV